VTRPAFQLDGLALEAMDEFSDASDYFWKSMDFIDDEILRELKKIAIYFPLTGDTDKDALALKYGEQRWSYEHKKIKKTFSYLIATGNYLPQRRCLKAIYCACARKLRAHLTVSLN
jgi:hypothetical protein